MVVDDDPSVLLLVDVLAEKMGFQVKAVSSGPQALEHLRDGLQPHVILLDIMMERIDGLTFMNHLREMPSVESTPVVAMSRRPCWIATASSCRSAARSSSPSPRPRACRRPNGTDRRQIQ